MNHAPEWIAKGMFSYKLNLTDTTDSLDDAAAKIAAVANKTDHAVPQLVQLLGAVGADEGSYSWDGTWPYWSRPTFRVGHSWEQLARFMERMHREHHAWISFHLNISDVNHGLVLYPETRAFFERLRDARCIYARPEGVNNQPWRGLPFVPSSLPADPASPGFDASGIFAYVDYQRLWDSGLAAEIIDNFYAHLPYAPPLLYLDVLGTSGWCIHPGYPDGALGGSLATQLDGRTRILEYIRAKGSEIITESADHLEELPTTFSWSHGGLAFNDYSAIGGGYGAGAMGCRGARGMHVYGNQSGYHLLGGNDDPLPENVTGRSRSSADEGLREWGTVDDLVQNCYLTVMQELYHIGAGHTRLPGGARVERLDAAQGRVRLDALTLEEPGTHSGHLLPAHAARVLGTATILDQPWATDERHVGDIDLAIGNGVAWTVDVEQAGARNLYIRYASPRGGRLLLRVNGSDIGKMDFPPTNPWEMNARLRASEFGNDLRRRGGYGDPWCFHGDHLVSVELQAGTNTIELLHHRIYAEWDDGSQAEWSLADGFRAWKDAVIFGQGFNRCWPDTWSGTRRIFAFSVDGCQHEWRLPAGWEHESEVTLSSLLATGRGDAVVLPVKEGQVLLCLQPTTPYVIEGCNK